MSLSRRKQDGRSLVHNSNVAHFDVFNGDADGICALHQLRMAEPVGSTLVTGAKRDVELLARVAAEAGDTVTTLDVSLDANRGALLDLLSRGVTVEYFDHHYAGAVPPHPNLSAHIDTASDICTSLIVDRHLQGRHRLWAITAAFGDNLHAPAHALARACGLSADDEAQLRELGESINYNAYGDSEPDLLIHPARLYERLHAFVSPFEFIAVEPIVAELRERRRQDMSLAAQVLPEIRLSCGAIYILPDAAWARRVRGEFGNRLAMSEPDKAHAILNESSGGGGYTVSVRAPINAPQGADKLCRAFVTGGGRAGAAGINHLPAAGLSRFVKAFEEAFGGNA